LLWRRLVNGKLGISFRRQAVIANRFIVDFLAPSVRLVVEVDGGYHRERGRADARRDEKLRRLGYRVLRLEAELVEREIERAVELVQVELARP
jgi:very-short-patch-repair endonuclease